MKCIVGEGVVLSRPLDGPLSPHIPGFAKWVRDQGYSLYSRHRQVRLAARFSRWLGEKGVDVSNVESEHVVRYLRTHARQVRIARGDAAALRYFLDFLRRQGVIPSERISPHSFSPVEQVVQEFRRYLLDDRALAPSTAKAAVEQIHSISPWRPTPGLPKQLVGPQNYVEWLTGPASS